jgi:tetratricopeptide (TPR) repeat protein
VWFYLGKLAWPHPLIFMYPRWEVSAAVWWQYLFPGALLLLAAGLWFWRGRLGFGPLVALLFFAGTLFPALGFVDVYPFRYSFVADHFQYLACLGPLALAGAGIERGLGWAAKSTPLFKATGCAVLLAVLGALTWVQCGQYSDVETLWRMTVAKNPGCWLGHNNLGAMLLHQGKLDEAAGHLKLALDIQPDDAEACYNLGNVLREQGKAVEAIAQYRKALDFKPDLAPAHNNLGYALMQQGEIAQAIAHYREALHIQPDLAEARNNLGHALFLQGEFLDAIAQFRKALDLQPDYPQARGNLGLALLRQGDFDGAMACLEKNIALPSDPAQRWHDLGENLFQQGFWIESMACCRRALSINPRFAEAWAGLGLACFNSGQIKEAEESWRKSLEINPAQPQIQNNLASVLATASDASLRDGPGAVALAEQANQANGGGNPIILYTLAAAYAEAGRFEEACATARKALAEAQAQKNDKLAGAVQEQLKLYEAGHPMRQTQ